jgi:hypothetical protein
LPTAAAVDFPSSLIQEGPPHGVAYLHSALPHVTYVPPHAHVLALPGEGKVPFLLKDFFVASFGQKIFLSAMKPAQLLR